MEASERDGSGSGGCVLFVLAAFVDVTLVGALPGEVEALLPAAVERHQQVGAVVPVADGQPLRVHLLLGDQHF